MEDEISIHESVSSVEDGISSHDDSEKEAIEKEWHVWLSDYKNHSNWIRDMSCYEKLQNLMYQSVIGEYMDILVEAYEKVPLARNARMPNCSPENQTALHLLVARPSAKEVVEKMLRNVDGDDVKMKDKKGNTVLHAAAAAKGIQNIDICKQILSYFPDLIEECNEDGKTALSLLTKGLIEDPFGGMWNTAVEGYEAMINTLNVTKLPPHSTPLHMAVERWFNEEDAKKTFDQVKDKENILKMKDEKDNTALHIAAPKYYEKDIYKSMADACPELVNEANCEGETPLFILAIRGSLRDYRNIYKYADPNTIDMPRNDGNTTLHCALLEERLDRAYQILQIHPSFRSCENNDGLTPLRILANIPTAFRSRTPPLTMVEHIIYSCIWVVDLEDEKKSEVDCCRQAISECFKTVKRLIMSGSQMMHRILSSRSCCLGDTKNPKDESESEKDLEKPDHEQIIRGDKENSKDTSSKPADSSDEEWSLIAPIKSYIKTCMVSIKSFIKICMVLIKSFIKTCLAPFMIIVSFLIKHILPGKLVRKMETMKRRHIVAYKIMEKLLLNYEASLEDPRLGNATILIAAEKGVTEMVEGIFRKNSKAGMCQRKTDMKYAPLLAIENRQSDVYELLTNFKKKGIHIYMSSKDLEGNNALHLAATRSSRQPWGMPTTMQLLWEIKWYNYVRDTRPEYHSTIRNKEEKTPSQVFWDEHKDLLQKNDLGQWLNTTSQSCSVVAGLVATVAYSSATTIPGGNNQEGVPNFKGNPAFGTFVISSFIALCFSLVSLVMFLSILISPYRGLDDANKILPVKLVVALGALLLSTGTMFISFCAGHFFYVKGKLTYAVLPPYAIGCLPVALLLITQFDSYTSLLWSLSRRKPRPWYDDDSLLPQLPPKS